MKKALSIVLSVMIIIIGIMPAAAAVNVPEIGVRVSEGEYDGKPVNADVVTKKVFTVVVSLPPVKALTTVNMHLQFDNSVLKVVDGGAAYNLVNGDKYNYYDGMFAHGIKQNKPNEYAMGIITSETITKANSRDFAYITFEVIDLTKESTTLNLYVNEFNTDDGDNSNDIDSQTLALSEIVRFDFPEDITEETTTGTSGETGATDESTTEASVSTITALINAIRELLKDNNASISDYIDAIVNILGNADIADMIEQLIGGNINIGDGFLEWIKGLGLDFGALEDILNEIIEFLKNLFGGGSDNPETTNKLTTNGAVGDPATTSAGSQTGSENTGDAGIALTATVCVAAAAAFVLTRKKKEE